MYVVQTSTQHWDIGSQQESAAQQEKKPLLFSTTAHHSSPGPQVWTLVLFVTQHETCCKEFSPPCPSFSASANLENSEEGREVSIPCLLFKCTFQDLGSPDSRPFNFLGMSSSQIICSRKMETTISLCRGTTCPRRYTYPKE